MNGLSGYDQWKTASPYADLEDRHCACGWLEEDHLSPEDYPGKVADRARELLVKWQKRFVGNPGDSIAVSEAAEELELVLSWCDCHGAICSGFEEAEGNNEI